MVVQKHFSIADGVFGADENEWNAAFFTRNRRFGFVISFDFDSDHT